MKKLLHFRQSVAKGAALIIVLVFIILGAAFSQTPPPCVYAVAGTMVINNAGANYVVGDRLRAIGGTECIEAFPFSLQVTSVNASGGITAATIIDADSKGYIAKPANPISFGGSATGTNFQASFTFATR